MRVRCPRYTFGHTLLIAFIFSALPVNAEEYAQPLPEQQPGITTITAEDLAVMLDSASTPVVIDARATKGRSRGYIEGSIHLADVDTHCASLAEVIQGQDKAAVFYCSSSKCGRSLNALKIAQSCHYRNVYWFRGGFEEWQNKGYPYVTATVPSQ